MGRPRTGHLERDSATGIWLARVTEKGERPWYSLETRDEGTARRKLRELNARIAREERAGRPPTPTFEAAGREWIALRRGQGVASVASDAPLLERYAYPEMGAELLGDVTAGHVRNALERALSAMITTIRMAPGGPEPEEGQMIGLDKSGLGHVMSGAPRALTCGARCPCPDGPYQGLPVRSSHMAPTRSMRPGRRGVREPGTCSRRGRSSDEASYPKLATNGNLVPL